MEEKLSTNLDFLRIRSFFLNKEERHHSVFQHFDSLTHGKVEPQRILFTAKGKIGFTSSYTTQVHS